MKHMEDKDEKMKASIYKEGAIISSSMNRDKQVAGHFPELGLCNRCSSLQGIVTESGAKGASCYSRMIQVTSRHRIRDCSSFWDRTYVGIQTLLDMNPLLVDPKEPIGF